jgi:hypothetical protein
MRRLDAVQTVATGKSASFMALKVASFRESRETVTRFRPASFNAWALTASAEPLVVSAMSISRPSGVLSAASMPTSSGRDFRSNGSPPVRRIFSTPWSTAIRASRAISSKVSSSSRSMNTKSLPKICFGMQ